MATAKIEFAVPMTCQKCVNTVQEALSNIKGIDNIDISLDRGTVVVETNLPYTIIQDNIEKTGKQAVLKGYGEKKQSAVAMLGGNSGYSVDNKVKGVVRFIEIEEGCILDGTVDNLSPGLHGMHIHECGDISQGCESIGEHYNPTNAVHGAPDNDLSQRHMGDLGNVEADETGRALFRKVIKHLSLSDIIGRSLAITANQDDFGQGIDLTSKLNGNSGISLACGIIARSSGLFQNSKKICACDGLTLWDERERAISNEKELVSMNSSDKSKIN